MPGGDKPVLVDGDPIVAMPWHEGRFPVPPATLHRFAYRENLGLAVTRCGIRQESRSNPWGLPGLDVDVYPHCPTCFPEGVRPDVDPRTCPHRIAVGEEFVDGALYMVCAECGCLLKLED